MPKKKRRHRQTTSQGNWPDWLDDWLTENLPPSQYQYIWCLHCEHVYHAANWAQSGRACPNCGASEALDGWDWKTIQEANNYPLVPQEGACYPQYGKEG
ncbi:MAG TPA: hypothetical protein VKT82_35140 [Ktedonobacterales bacterium]|nr:hypothetical protein [Ktedonobacterales bacterium]